MNNYPKPQSNQEFFDNAVDWLLVRETPVCRNEEDFCAYRDKDRTTACVIGAFIPDSMFDDDPDRFENRSIRDLVHPNSRFTMCQEVVDLFQHVDNNLLTAVQDVHDSACRTKDRIRDMNEIASRFGLTLNPTYVRETIRS